jgi:hypothetical protein
MELRIEENFIERTRSAELPNLTVAADNKKGSAYSPPN